MDGQKICASCGAVVPETVNFCQYCGSTSFSSIAAETPAYPANDEVTYSADMPVYPEAAPMEQNAGTVYSTLPTDPAAFAGAEVQPEEKGNGNIFAGVVGAVLFALIGGILYFLVYQIGFVAGICGLVMFVLANFGYNLFAGTRGRVTVAGMISAAVATIVMIYVSEQVSVGFQLYNELKDTFELTIFDAIAGVSELAKDNEELSGAIASDLAFSYIFGAVAVLGSLFGGKKKGKKRK